MEIREARITDIDDIFEMEDLFLAPFKKQDVHYELVENPVSKVLVAIEDEVVVGFIDFWITFDSATICQVAVKTNYQNKGIARKLIEKSIEILKENKVLFYTLEVREHNLKARTLYEKMGFEFVVLKEKYYSNGDNAIYMLKGLN